MKTLNGVKIAVGVTGGISAYKCAEVVSRLVKLGADVTVMMTESAKEFISPLTFGTLTKNKVITDMFSNTDYSRVEHIAVAAESDVFLICPATANIIGKVACGIADDFMSTAILATKSPVIFAPAMNNNMCDNPILQDNIKKLKKYGYYFIEPGEGMLACGTSGKGRLPEYDEIVETVENIAYKNKDLSGKKVLITAGPTIEKIDPVRYITNHSSGKMGYAIAKAAVLRGADVTLVSGNVNIKPHNGIRIVKAESAMDMYNAVMSEYPQADIIIKSAAVADFRPDRVASGKIKKDDGMTLELVANPDILKEIGKNKGNRIVVGFCMETSDLLDNAEKKLKNKNLDFIVANDLSRDGAGFKCDTNIVTIIDKSGNKDSLEIMEKEEIAHIILDKCIL